MRDRFAADDEWCERRLLARVHRYTVKRLRARSSCGARPRPLRFLCEWQRVLPESDAGSMRWRPTPRGRALRHPRAQENEIIPSRMVEYEPQWLDEHCRAGRVVWARLAARGAANGADPERSHGASPIRSTPITLMARRGVPQWAAMADHADPVSQTSRARAVADFIREHGASFFDEIADHVGMLPVEVEDALAELVALGMVNSDSFAGLRVLLMPSGRRGKSNSYTVRRKRRLALFGMADAGRWALVRRPAAGASELRDEAVEYIVRALLRRWGVIFWKLLGREAGWLPPWRDMLMCCRRLEARGEIRGGRFVAGFSGEQYATPEAVGLLRDVRRKPPTRQFVAVSAADPLNLIGIITPGARLPSLSGNRLLYRDGLPMATYAAEQVHFLAELAESEQWEVQTALLRRHSSLVLDDLA